jgi:hypothetical protein
LHLCADRPADGSANGPTDDGGLRVITDDLTGRCTRQTSDDRAGGWLIGSAIYVFAAAQSERCRQNSGSDKSVIAHLVSFSRTGPDQLRRRPLR